MYRIAFIISLVIISSHTALGLSGSGTEAEPWRIETPADFDEFAGDENYWAGYTRLETDVNLAGITYTTAVIAPDTYTNGLDFDGTAFTGVFDGNDHEITKLTIDDGGAGNYYLGLFGFIDDGGEVRNLGLEGVSIFGTGSLHGGLVGNSYYGSVSSDCYSTSSVSGSLCIGGIVGENLGILLNCNFTGSIIGMNEVGGLVGYNLGGISNCYTSCFVNGPVDAGGLVGINSRNVLNCYSTGYVSGYENTGGLVGKNIDGSIWNCFSTGDVIGDWFAGGLVGYNVQPRYGNGIGVSNCYSNGDVDGIYCIGGLVGINGQEGLLGQEPGYIHNSYSTGTVNGFSGGLVAIHVRGDIEGSFWDTETSGQLESDGGTGKTTDEMQKTSTFTDAGWDFEEIWDIGEKQTYPYLRQYLSADLNHDGMVDMVDFAILAGHWLKEGVVEF